MNDILSKKKEVLFLFDTRNMNPNGDMLKDNAPRYDEASMKAEISDVRIKRTIRDYALIKGEEVFIKPYVDKDGFVADCKIAAEMEGIDNSTTSEDVKSQLKKYFDIRVFGGVIPLKAKTKKDVASVNLTGATQFGYSRTIHEAEIEFVQGTGAFSSGAGKAQDTIRSEYILKYGLFATYALVNQHNAKHSGMTNADFDSLLSYLWNGTKNLNTRSKFGQQPRLLLAITYKENSDAFVGNLNNLLETESEKDDLSYREISDFRVKFDRLLSKIELFKDDIESVEYSIEYDFEQIHKDIIPTSWIRNNVLK